jgi:YcxB-like protein
MEIEYTLTPEDVKAFSRYHHRTSSLTRRSIQMRIMWGMLASAMLVCTFYRMMGGWTLIIVALFWLLYLLTYPSLIQMNINAYVKRIQKEGKNKAVWNKHRLTINAEELIEKSEVEETHLRWTGIERLAENSDYIFIYVTTVSAHVIPKRYFSDNAQAQLFYQTAKNYFDQAHQAVG